MENHADAGIAVDAPDPLCAIKNNIIHDVKNRQGMEKIPCLFFTKESAINGYFT